MANSIAKPMTFTGENAFHDGGLIKKLCHVMINKISNVFGVPMDFLHFIVDVSVSAFVDFMLFTKLARHRQKLPSDAAHLARILSTQSADCGGCVQSNVNLALHDGMSAEWITAAIESRPEVLPAELREIYEFTRQIMSTRYADDELREAIRRRHGNEGLVNLAAAIASAQVFPLTKQVLGFAKSCSKVQVVVKRAA